MDTSIAIQVLPKAYTNGEIVRVVDQVIDYIKSTGYTYQVGAFETTIEGDYAGLMEIIKQAQLIAIKAGTPSVMSYIKIAYHPDQDGLTILEKTEKHQH